MPDYVSQYDCNKKYKLNSGGHCTSGLPDTSGASDPQEGCVAYCEVRLTKMYGQERPYSNSVCRDNTSCQLSTAESVTITNSYAANVGVSRATDISSSILQETFNIGATYTYSDSLGYTVTNALTKPLGANECGYWTFIPYLLESCGTFTVSSVSGIPEQHGSQISTCDKSHVTDTPNFYNITPVKDSKEFADGSSIFVFVDCNTNAVLPLSQQDKIYGYPGVSTGLGNS